MSEATPTSLVIPTYLRPDSLERCIHSLLEGELRPDEIIIVGRESDQATRQVVHALCSWQVDSTRLRSAWVSEPGHIPPVEAGLHLASGELVAFIDDDVTVTPQWFALILRHFSDPSVGVVGGRVVVPHSPPPKLRGKPGHLTWYGKTWGNVGSVGGDRILEVDAVMECNWVWRRDLLRTIGIDPVLNFDDASMYGLDLCLQAKALGFRVLYDPRALVYHHTKPRAPELDRAHRPARVFSYCRNFTYIMLKRLPAWRKPVFLAWWFGIGESAAVGLAAWMANALFRRPIHPGEDRAAVAGKVEGIRLWLGRGGRSHSRKGLVAGTNLKQDRLRQAMTERKRRILLVATHPTQYAAPVFRLLASDPALEIQVIYCSSQGAKPAFDRDFGREVQWDVPVLEGYPSLELPNRSRKPGLRRFWGLLNTGLWTLIRRGQFDAVVLYTGYRYATFWIGVLAAKTSGSGLIFGTDAWTLFPLDGRRWKRHVKRLTWPLLFRLADVAVVPSSGGVKLMRSLGIPERRVVLTPYAVDNRRWQQAVARIDRAAVRTRWGIPAEAPVILFSAKLQPWKRPLDLLHAFAHAAVPGTYLLFAGEGPLRGEIEKEIEQLGLNGRVKLLGFVNQSALPEVYGAADALVLPSHYDAFGVVVNEAMLCGCIPVVSDKVGARFDLIEEGKTGFVFPVGDVEKLAALLVEVFSDPVRLRRMSEAATEKIAAWSPELNVARLLEAIDAARARCRRTWPERAAELNVNTR